MQEQRFLLMTVFLVALVGAPAVYSVVREPQELTAEAATENLNPDADSAQRSPASIESNSQGRSAIKSKSVVLDYTCKGKSKTFEVDGTLMRLKGKGCLNENWKDLTVVNQTNGFTASVIFLKSNDFTTDFIDLKEGDNHLSIQGTDETGKAVTQKFVVKRRFPASAENSRN
jgi:hypothetical protein